MNTKARIAKILYPMPAWAKYQLTRWDKDGLVEDVCAHGVGHPNTAWLKAHKHLNKDGYLGIHGCDGCCWAKETVRDKKKR